MGRPGKSRFQRQQRAQARQRSEREFSSVPHSFVFPRGRAGRSLRSLCRDLRRVLEPFTARNLQVRRSNSLRDLVAVAGPLGVTQFLVLSKSQTGINLKLFRLPGGPTLTFKVLQVNLNSIRRCLLISYDAESQLLEFRHYSVQVVPVGLSRGLRKILQEKFPNLGRMDDVSQLLMGYLGTLGTPWGHLGDITGTPWGHLGDIGDIGDTLGTPWGHLGDIRDTLGTSGTPWGHLGDTGTPWGHLGDIGDTLGTLGDTLGTPWGHQGHLGDTLGTSQGHLGDTLGTLGTPWGHLGDIRDTLGTLGTPWRHIRDITETPWGHQGHLGDITGTSWAGWTTSASCSWGTWGHWGHPVPVSPVLSLSLCHLSLSPVPVSPVPVPVLSLSPFPPRDASCHGSGSRVPGTSC
uniref:Uncharacterized protein n=1 Tax=Geospiza parvula TaxID=87175 RepID=A0A8U8BN04_GEOPR